MGITGVQQFQQWRVVYRARGGGANGVAFVDAPDEEGARAFFAVAFPWNELVSIALEQVDPCAQYERRPESR